MPSILTKIYNANRVAEYNLLCVTKLKYLSSNKSHIWNHRGYIETMIILWKTLILPFEKNPIENQQKRKKTKRKMDWDTQITLSWIWPHLCGVERPGWRWRDQASLRSCWRNRGMQREWTAQTGCAPMGGLTPVKEGRGRRKKDGTFYVNHLLSKKNACLEGNLGSISKRNKTSLIWS